MKPLENTGKYQRIESPRSILVIGHVDGIVKEVISPTVWIPATDSRYHGRFECKGKEQDDSPYLEKDIRHLVNLGQNPVSYYQCD